MKRRQFNQALAATAALVAVPYVRAQAQKLRIGVVLPKSGVQGFIGQSCQKGAELAPGVIKEMLGVDIEIMSADNESNVDTSRTRTERLDRAVGPVHAKEIEDMMVSVVEGGTGTAAQIPGYRIGGKTGTAETGRPGVNTTWFIAFAGRERQRPEVAIAVALENQTSTGGETAAPIAREVMQAILRPTGNP